MLETADKKPTHHLSKGLVIGLVAPVVTVALLIKHHREKKLSKLLGINMIIRK